MLAKGEDVKFVEKINSRQDHTVNALNVVFFMLEREKNYVAIYHEV